MRGKYKLTTTIKGGVVIKTLSTSNNRLVKQLVFKKRNGKKIIMSYKTQKYKIEYGGLKDKRRNKIFYGPVLVEQYVEYSMGDYNTEKLECSTIILRHGKDGGKHFIILPLDEYNVIVVNDTGEVYTRMVGSLYHNLLGDSKILFDCDKRFLAINDTVGISKFELPLTSEEKVAIILKYDNLEYSLDTINSIKLPIPRKLLFLNDTSNTK